MDDNLSGAQQTSQARIGEVTSLAVLQAAPQIGRLLKIVVERSNAELRESIRYQGNCLDRRSVDALRTAERAAAKICRAYGLVNPYEHLGLRCQLDPPECSGASLGLAVFAAIMSVLTERPISEEFALTGEIEITDDGAAVRVHPVDCLPSKLTAARDEPAIKRVIIPWCEEKAEFCRLQASFPEIALIAVSDVEELFPILFKDPLKEKDIIEPLKYILPHAIRRLNEGIIARVAEDVQLRSFHYETLPTYRRADTEEKRKPLIELFYRGQDISLAAIHNHLSVPRNPEDFLLDRICTDWTCLRLGVIFADPYQGKTTLLRRLQHKLLAKGKVVLWKRAGMSLEMGEVERFYNRLSSELGGQPIYLLIDDLEECQSWESFLRTLASSRVRSIVVATASRSKRNLSIFKDFEEYYQFFKTELWFVEGEEYHFIQKLKEVGLLEESVTCPPQGIRHGKQLASFFNIIGLSNIREKYENAVLQNMMGFPPLVKEALYLICSLYAFRIWMPVSLLTRLQYDRDYLLQQASDVIVPVFSEEGGSPTYLRVPSPELAQKILAYAREVSQWDHSEHLKHLLKNITTEISTAVSLCLALAQREAFHSCFLSPEVSRVIDTLLLQSSWQEALLWGDVYAHLRLREKLTRCFQRALQILREQEPAALGHGYTRFGLALYSMEDYAEAGKQFLRACKLSRPDNFPAWMLGECYEQEGDLLKALAWYVRSAKREKTSQGYGTALNKVRRLQRDALDPQLKRTFARLRLPLARRAVRANPTMARNHSDVGVEYQNIGSYSEAIAAFKRAIDIEKAADFSYYRIGECHEALGELGEARAWYLKAIAIESSTNQSLRGFTDLAFRWLERGGRDALCWLCAQVKALDPSPFSRFSNFADFGKVLFELGQYEEALTYLEQAKTLLLQETLPGKERLLAAVCQKIAECHEALMAIDDAMIAYKEYAEYDNDPRTYGILGRKAMDLERYEDAVHFFSEALRRKPGDAKNLSQRAAVKMALGNYADAIPDLEAAIASRRATAREGRAMADDQRHLQECWARLDVQVEEEAMSEDQSWRERQLIQLHVGYARVLQQKGSRPTKGRDVEIIDEAAIETACEHYLKATSLRNTSEAWGRFGSKLFELKRTPERVKEAFEHSLECDPLNFFSLRQYGYILLQMKQYESASAILSRAIEVGPQQHAGAFYLATAYLNRGQARDCLGQRALATDDYAHALGLAEDMATCLKVAQVLEDIGAIDQALAAYEKAEQLSAVLPVAAASATAEETTDSPAEEAATIEVTPPAQGSAPASSQEEGLEETVGRYLELSETSEREGDSRLARIFCEKAVSVDPRNLRAQLRRASLCLKEGQKPAAEKILLALTERRAELVAAGLKDLYEEYWAKC